MLPTASELAAIGRSDLGRKIEEFGGSQDVARRLGMETPIMVAGPVGQHAVAPAAGVVSDAVVLDEQWHRFNMTTDCTHGRQGMLRPTGKGAPARIEAARDGP